MINFDFLGIFRVNSWEIEINTERTRKKEDSDDNRTIIIGNAVVIQNCDRCKSVLPFYFTAIQLFCWIGCTYINGRESLDWMTIFSLFCYFGLRDGHFQNRLKYEDNHLFSGMYSMVLNKIVNKFDLRIFYRICQLHGVECADSFTDSIGVLLLKIY